MSIKNQILDNDGVYFFTFTCFKWIPLFEHTKSYDLVYKWFDYLKSKGHPFKHRSTEAETPLGIKRRKLLCEIVVH